MEKTLLSLVDVYDFKILRKTTKYVFLFYIIKEKMEFFNKKVLIYF